MQDKIYRTGGIGWLAISDLYNGETIYVSHIDGKEMIPHFPKSNLEEAVKEIKQEDSRE